MGLFGALMMLVLFNVEHLAFNYSYGTFQQAVSRSSNARRIVSLLIAGSVGGTAWYLPRRYTNGERSDVDDTIWTGEGQLSFRRCFCTGLISELVIGMGASIGRENAPKLMGAASGSALSGWLGLTSGQRKVLMACGAGAGLGAVYNVTGWFGVSPRTHAQRFLVDGAHDRGDGDRNGCGALHRRVLDLFGQAPTAGCPRPQVT